tara:strand:- start:2305 stop:2484 length:180 start_codon:yes stop_codon:yes gene_type:complete
MLDKDSFGVSESYMYHYTNSNGAKCITPSVEFAVVRAVDYVLIERMGAGIVKKIICHEA